MAWKNGISRKRELSTLSVQGSGQEIRWLSNFGGAIYRTNNYTRNYTDASWCTDETHPHLAPRQGARYKWDRKYNLGGPLDLLKVEYDMPQIDVRWDYSNAGNRTYTGMILPEVPIFNGGASQPLTQSQVLGYSQVADTVTRVALGTKAIARCKPASPEAALLTTIVELHREGIPGTLGHFLEMRDRVDAFRGHGKLYLNLEFGWYPFINDVKKVTQAFLNQDAILRDLELNNGKPMRRRYRFPAETTSTLYIADNIQPWPNLLATGQSGGRKVTDLRSKETWFAGEFQYRIPPMSGPGLLRNKARFLMGIDPTPEQLWNLAPWTWLADWFANTGDVMSNISSISSDDLVMRYGYLMQESRFVRETTHLGVFKTAAGTRLPSTISGKVTISHKTRIGASPYGFGVTWGDLSPKQYAILVGLGLSNLNSFR